MVPRIIYEDKHIIILDKPGGMPAHMIKQDEKGTIVNFLIGYCPSIVGVGTSPLQSGLVHRLDTNTSGLLLAAKDNESFLNLRRQFNEHKVLKEYIALVHGGYNGPKIIKNFIGPDPKSKRKVKVFSTSGGKGIKGTRPAITEVIERKIMAAGDYTFLRLKIKTGVRHQIRSHLANLGYPIVGDLLYQNLKTRKKDQFGIRRHFLHAHKLGFYHPKTNRWMEFTSPLPEELDGILKR